MPRNQRKPGEMDEDMMDKPAGPKGGGGMGEMEDDDLGGDVEAQVDAADQEVEQATKAAIDGSVPPAEEPLPAERVDRIAGLTMEVVEKLTGGQVSAFEVPPAGEDVQQVPAELYRNLVGIRYIIDEAGKAGIKALEPYAELDPNVAVTSQDGLIEATALLQRLATDEKAAAALQTGKGGETKAKAPEKKPEAAEEKDDLDGLI